MSRGRDRIYWLEVTFLDQTDLYASSTQQSTHFLIRFKTYFTHNYDFSSPMSPC